MVGQATGTYHPQPRHCHESTVSRASKPGRQSDGNAEGIVHTFPTASTSPDMSAVLQKISESLEVLAIRRDPTLYRGKSGRSFSRRRTSFSRSHIYSRVSGVCWYHHTFGDAARSSTLQLQEGRFKRQGPAVEATPVPVQHHNFSRLIYVRDFNNDLMFLVDTSWSASSLLLIAIHSRLHPILSTLQTTRSSRHSARNLCNSIWIYGDNSIGSSWWRMFRSLSWEQMSC